MFGEDQPDKSLVVDSLWSNLTKKELAKLNKCHLDYSIALGRKVGIIEVDDDYDHFSPTDYSELILNSIYDGSFESFVSYNHYVANNNWKTVMNFLRSKDDSLILQISALIYTFIKSKAVDPAILQYSRLFPIGKDRPYLEPENKSDDSNEELKIIDGISRLSFQNNKPKNEPKSDRDSKAYELAILNSYDEPKYDHDVVSLLTKLISTDPPFRLITFKFLSIIVMNLWYAKQLKNWLYDSDYEELARSYVTTIKIIYFFLKDDHIYSCFLEIFEKQWNEFEFVNHDNLVKVSKSPWQLVSVYEDKHKDSMPSYLQLDQSKIKVLKDAISKFIALGSMLYALRPKKMSPFDEYPFRFEGRDVYSWNIDDIIVVTEEHTLIYCHYKVGKYGYVRYIIMDQEFFILAEPDYDEGPYKTVSIRTKEPLKNIITKDNNADKALIIGVYSYDSQGDKSYYEFQLMFENSVNFKSVKKAINDNKRQQNEFLGTQIYSYFDHCQTDVGFPPVNISK